jgi:hypothetical protein
MAFAFAYSRMMINKSGNSELTTLTPQSNLTLPNTTLVKNPLGADVNLLQSIQNLQTIVNQQQGQINFLLQQLNNDTVIAPSCQWEGVACYCSYTHAPPLNDIAILTGTNCSAGKFVWTHVLHSIVATSLPGCAAINTTGLCTFVTT